MDSVLPKTMQNVPQRAWVVFSGESELRWLRWLKPGFRHCFILLNDGQCWVSYDPMAHKTEILVHHMPGFFNLPDWLEKRGHKVMAAKPENVPQKTAPLGFFSCVEAVKRVLGIHNILIITPWQLYRYLERREQSVQFLPEGDLSWEV